VSPTRRPASITRRPVSPFRLRPIVMTSRNPSATPNSGDPLEREYARPVAVPD